MICCLLGFKANFMVRIHYWKCLVIAVADIYRLRLNKRNCKANENGNLQCWCKGILRLLELDCLGRDFQKQPYSYMELKVLYLGSWMPRSFVSSTKGDFFFSSSSFLHMVHHLNDCIGFMNPMKNYEKRIHKYCWIPQAETQMLLSWRGGTESKILNVIKLLIFRALRAE